MQQQLYKIALILAVIWAGIVAAQQFPSDEQNSDTLTTNYGAAVPNNRDSLTVGERGPTLLEVKVCSTRIFRSDRNIFRIFR